MANSRRKRGKKKKNTEKERGERGRERERGRDRIGPRLGDEAVICANQYGSQMSGERELGGGEVEREQKEGKRGDVNLAPGCALVDDTAVLALRHLDCQRPRERRGGRGRGRKRDVGGRDRDRQRRRKKECQET